MNASPLKLQLTAMHSRSMTTKALSTSKYLIYVFVLCMIVLIISSHHFSCSCWFL